MSLNKYYWYYSNITLVYSKLPVHVYSWAKNSELIFAIFNLYPILKAVWSGGRLVATTLLNKLQHKMFEYFKYLITGSPAGKQQGLKSTGVML